MDTISSNKIIKTYYAITALTTLSQSVIWGINTLFLISAGMDIFQVMIINAAYTASQFIFEIPTGVIADTMGRRKSYLFSVVIILLSTVIYGVVGYTHSGIGYFIFASILIGLGFTFYTGAVDAWMIDALKRYRYKGKTEVIFSRAGIIFGTAMLFGTTAGGVLAQYQLWIPYAVRVVLLIPALFIGYIFMRDTGFVVKKLRLSEFGEETLKIARVGLKYGYKNSTVRNLMFITLTQSIFFIFGFYSWQKYFFDLLNQNLIWVSGVIAALIGLSQILGNVLVTYISRKYKDRGKIIMYSIVVQAVSICTAALTKDFYFAVSAYLLAMLAASTMAPIKQAWLNSEIPGEQRATLISLDALYSDGGGTIGQIGLGYLSKSIGIPFAWFLGGLIQLVGIPFVLLIRSRYTKGIDKVY